MVIAGALLSSAASGCHAAPARGQDMGHAAPGPATPSIGTATREPDGTIVLTLRADRANGAVGDAVIRYAPTDKDYAAVARHVGPIPKGGTVPVRPFPSP